MSDHRIIADGLFPGGMDPAKLTELGRAEVRAAIEALLRVWDRDNARLALALEQLDRGAAEVERLRALLGEVRGATAMPLPDPGAHSWRAFYDAACTRLARCASAARRALADEQEKTG